MNPQLRATQRYSFKKPDLTRLREMEKQVSDPRRFRNQYGRLLDLIKVRVDDGILETLVQFYDPVYHCFTFPDYQLLPTLEEYSYWVGLPVSKEIPFTGLELAPKEAAIAKALYLKPSDLVEPHFTIKNGYQGLTARFLYRKASDFAKAGKTIAFESILALLIYGLFLFPNMDNFVDINAIKIFLTNNPVPTLLADTYHSIHHRHRQEGGAIVCCAPLLYKWFASHLPRSVFAITETGKTSWSDRLMPLTPADIVWAHPAADVEGIIGSCGEFQNVPLIGTCGGITYSPTLAMRQYGYPMKTPPDSRSLSGEFYLNSEVHIGLRELFGKAWYAVHMFDRIQLGKKQDFAHESYTKWVIDRATTFLMPYPIPRYLSAAAPEIPVPLLPKTQKEYQERMHASDREKATLEWKLRKKEHDYDVVVGMLEQKNWESEERRLEILRLEALIKEKDAALDRVPGHKKKRSAFFASTCSHPSP
jgi:hypothetical protein